MPGGVSKYRIDEFTEEMGATVQEIANLFSSYVTEMSEETASMYNCLGGGNWEMLQKVVHNIKGVSANLNIFDAYETAAEFDQLLKDKDFNQAEEYVRKLEDVLNNAETEIRHYFEQKGCEI